MDDDALASVPFFSALSPAARRAVAPYADQIELAAGTQLIEEGERGYLFFVIGSGTAKVFQDGREIRDLGEGDFFGEIALLETSERTASVIAGTPMQLIVLTETAFKRLINLIPGRGRIIAFDGATADAAESASLERVLRKPFCNVERYGSSSRADWQITNMKFAVRHILACKCDHRFGSIDATD